MAVVNARELRREGGKERGREGLRERERTGPMWWM